MKKNLLSILMLIAIGLCFSFSIQAQDWERLSDPKVPSTVYTLFSKGNELFAGMDSGVYVSQNKGITWTARNTGFEKNNHRVKGFAYDGSRMYAAVQGLGVYYSDNNGGNWKRSILPISPVKRVVVIGNRVIAAADGGVFYSDNKGINWSKASTDISYGFTYSLEVAGNRVFASTSGHSLISLDSGKTWTGNGQISNTVRDFLFHNNVLYASALVGGVYKSTNLGDTWTQINNGLIPNNNFNKHTSSLGVVGNTVYIGTPADGIFKTENEGASWSLLNDGTVAGEVFSMQGHNGEIFGSIDTEGVWKFNVNDGKWEQTSKGLAQTSYQSGSLTSNGTFYVAGTAKGVFVSSDKGNTWTRKWGNQQGDVVYSGDNLILTRSGATFLSTDHGESFSKVASFGSAEKPKIKGSEGMMKHTFNLYKTTNSGVTWTEINIPAIYGTDEIKSFAWEGNRIAYTSLPVFSYKTITLNISNDGGNSWVSYPFNYGTEYYPFSMVFVPDGLLISTHDGVEKTTDNGKNFKQIFDEGGYFQETGNKIYLSFNSDTIYVSANNGEDWDIYGRGPANSNNYDLEQAGDDFTLSAFTGGYFRVSSPVITSNNHQSDDFFSNIAVFPNPTFRDFKINSTENPKRIQVQIYSANGTLLINSGNMENGFHIEKPGIYLVKIMTEDKSTTRKVVVSGSDN